MKKKHIHFMFYMNCEVALKSIKLRLLQNGFAIQDRQEEIAKAGMKSGAASRNRHELSVSDTQSVVAQNGTADSGITLPRIVVCASHGGFAEVFVRQDDEEVGISSFDSLRPIAEATVLRLTRALLEAGRFAFERPELAAEDTVPFVSRRFTV